MSEVITGILLKFVFGFISDKIRTYGAEKLQEGDLTDQKVRGFIVRDLDDIKFKLDGLSRKDLLTSVSHVQQGVERLNMCLGESLERGNHSTSELRKDATNVGTNTSAQTKPAQQSVASHIDDREKLAEAIRKVKIESSERFQSAKESFKEAGKKASEAFHNAALKTEERVLATEARIASGTLEHLDDPEFAANNCLQYLRELHDMRAIKEMYSVEFKDGIKARVKSAFKKDSRNEILDAVTTINLCLANFISKFTKRRMAVLDWPMIECGKQVVHPIHAEEETLEDIKKMQISLPWKIVAHKKPIEEAQDFVVDSHSDVICVSRNAKDGTCSLGKLEIATGVVTPFCNPTSDVKIWGRNSIAIDENDAVYVVSHKIDSVDPKPMLSVYNSDGEITNHCLLEFIEKQVRCVSVTKDKTIVICTGRSGCYTLYLCDVNGKPMSSFPIDMRPKSAGKTVLVKNVFSLSKESGDNEIVVVTEKGLSGDHRRNVKIVFCVYTLEGKKKKKFELVGEFTSIFGIARNHLTKNYIVCSRETTSKVMYVECFSESGEQLNLLFMGGEYVTGKDYYGEGVIMSHASGTICLTQLRDSDSVLYLQSPTSCGKTLSTASPARQFLHF